MGNSCRGLCCCVLLLLYVGYGSLELLPCHKDKLTVYKVIVNTFWSKELFPKQYPDWRPPAQWSKVIGRSHNSSVVLFHLGGTATEGFRVFVQTGKSDTLDEQSQGEGGIYDEFNAPPITKGVGKTEAEFFVDGNHSKVSLVARIVPSPDWFIGLDSLDLCVKGSWIKTKHIKVGPMDAGTDSGFTFTSPNWATEPRAKISKITSSWPNHPANSFYYPDYKELPPIASFTFLKVKEYSLSEEYHYSDQDLQHMVDPFNAYYYPVSTTTDHNRLSNEIIQENTIKDTTVIVKTPIKTPIREDFEPKNKKELAIFNSIKDSYRKRRLRKGRKERKGRKGRRRGKTRRIRPPRNCRVSDWSDWSACSKTCGIGESTRTRTVIKHSRRGGRPCPPLTETKWCGSARGCRRSYFNWS